MARLTRIIEAGWVIITAILVTMNNMVVMQQDMGCLGVAIGILSAIGALIITVKVVRLIWRQPSDA